MKTYSKYKPSSIQWIGDIPEHWDDIRIKYLGKIVNGYAFKSDEFTDSGVRVMKISNIQTMQVDWSDESFIDEKYYERLPEYRINKDDIVFALTRPIISTGIKAAIVKTSEKILLNQRNAVLRLTDEKNSRFLYYILVNNKFTQEFDSRIDKTGQQPNISSTDIGDICIPFPLLSEQTAISNFLDHRTAQIDNAIAKKQQLMELLEEERKAVVNEAVTKGINKKIKLKTTGVDWLGEVPEHWQIKKIKHTSYVKGRVGWNGLRSDEFLDSGYSYLITGTDFENGLVSWNTCYHIDKERYEEDPFIQLQENDLLITKDGTIGKTAIVKDLNGYACLNSGIFVIRPLNGFYITSFLYYILNSNVFTQFINFTSSGSTIQHLYQNVFNEFKFTVPPISEQTVIVNYIGKQTAKINCTISHISQEIELLKEYRQSLIFEAVTGKIKVEA